MSEIYVMFICVTKSDQVAGQSLGQWKTSWTIELKNLFQSIHNIFVEHFEQLQEHFKKYKVKESVIK